MKNKELSSISDMSNETTYAIKELELELDPTYELLALKNGIRKYLRGVGIYNPRNLYRFIPGNNENGTNLTTKGTDHPEFDSIFAFSHEEIFGRSSRLPREYLFNYGDIGYPYSSMIAIYDSSQFVYDGMCHYTFKNPENKLRALIAAVNVNRKF